MRHFFTTTALILAVVFASSTQSFAGTQHNSNAITEQTSNSIIENEVPVKANHLPIGEKTHIPIEKDHTHIPTWDELAHIHHFHHNRLKKIKRHFKKSVFLSKLLLFLCHAAVLYISFLHLTH